LKTENLKKKFGPKRYEVDSIGYYAERNFMMCTGQRIFVSIEKPRLFRNGNVT
jgi:hypothetical protein